MLLGYLPAKNKSDSPKPLFLPMGGLCLVGKECFALLQGQNNLGVILGGPIGTYTFTEIPDGSDIAGTLDPIVAEPVDFHLIEFASFSIEQARSLNELYPNETFYLLCPTLSDLEYRSLPKAKSPFQNEEASWNHFTTDLVGLPRKEAPTPKPRVEKHATIVNASLVLGEKAGPRIETIVFVPKPIEIKPEEPKTEETAVSAPEPFVEEPKAKKENAPKEKHYWTMPLTVFPLMWQRIKRDGLNPFFAIVFLALGFATTLGYFFLGENSGDAFRIACIAMASVFPLMAAIPVGFMFHDSKCRFPHQSIFVMAGLTLVVFFAIMFPMIALGLGNANGWKESELTLFTVLSLSAIAWIALRLCLEKPISRLNFGKKKK